MGKGAVLALSALAALDVTGCTDEPRRAPADDDAALHRAAAWLWDQQAADGGWHSSTYGLLRSGQSLTPFVLLGLLEVDESVAARPAGAVDRAVAFLRAHVDARGCLGLADDVPDYPNYATALAVRALQSAGTAPDLVDKMLRYLRGQQFGDELGWLPDHPAYGGFGMGGEPRRPPNHGHLDLSMTRHVLEAFAGTDADDPLVRRALRFLGRSQNDDGGFVFSPAIGDLNKAGPRGEGAGDGWRSYGTPTADGILALLALGVPPEDRRVGRAGAWLTTRHRAEGAPGLPDGAAATWASGLSFYYLAASSRALAGLGIDTAPAGVDWRQQVNSRLGTLQAADGSFRNPNGLVKEDDPLIATSLALRALSCALDRMPHRAPPTPGRGR